MRIGLASVLVLSACQGVIGGGDGSGSGGPGGPGGPGATTQTEIPLRRLAASEYAATVTDLVTKVEPTDASAILAAASAALKAYPADLPTAAPNEKHGGYYRLDQLVQQEHVDSSYAVADVLGQEMTKTPARVTALAGACATDADPSNDDACLTAFVRSFGALALRRPPSDDDITYYRGVAKNAVTAAALADVVTVMLASPRFYYLVESGAATLGPNLYALDAYELASRLSYQFLGTMPDDELFTSAQSGDLLTDAGYAKEVDRLAQDPRATATAMVFFEQWLRLDELAKLNSRNGDPQFDAFAGANEPGPALRAEMIAEVLDSARYVVSHGGTLADFVTDTRSYARNADLAAIYGVPVWDGTSAPPPLPPERAGLLTRGAFLATGTANTRPIMRGVFMRTGLMCDAIPPPPANAAATPINPMPGQTTRQVIEAITQQQGTPCAGCHTTLINPLGFVGENFDGLGRYRTSQVFLDATGKNIGSAPIDATTVPLVVPTDSRTATSMTDLTKYILDSGKVEDCFARQYFRFTFRRVEDVTADAPALADIAASARGGRSLADALKHVVMRPEFKQKVIAP